MKIVDKGITYVVKSVSEGYELLRKWGIPVLQTKDGKLEHLRRQPRPQPMDCSKEQSEENKSSEASKGDGD